MDEAVVYITKEKLIKTVGLSFTSVLDDLKEAGVLNSFTDAIELRLDKDKARHIQSVLEFYDTREVPTKPKGFNKKDQD